MPVQKKTGNLLNVPRIFLIHFAFYNMISYWSECYSKTISIFTREGFYNIYCLFFQFPEKKNFWIILKYFDASEEFCSYFISP